MKFERCDQRVFSTSRLTSGCDELNAAVWVIAVLIGIIWIAVILALPMMATRAKRKPKKVKVGR